MSGADGQRGSPVELPRQSPPEPTPIDRSDASQSGPIIARRQGDLIRVTTGVAVDARCQTCGRVLTNAGAAASHARASRHVVACEYRSSFVYAPIPEPER